MPAQTEALGFGPSEVPGGAIGERIIACKIRRAVTFLLANCATGGLVLLILVTLCTLKLLEIFYCSTVLIIQTLVL